MDIDDVIQDAYCRLATLQCVDHIDRPAAYFMQIVKNAWRDRLRRSQVVRLGSFTENAALCVEDDAMSVEAAAIAREELARIDSVLAALPERCRTIFTLKRIEGMSQREIAQRMSVSENVVENDIQKALRAIQRMLRDVEDGVQDRIVDDRRHG